jgi:hypothetical protein
MISHEALRESNKLHHCATIVWTSDSYVCAARHINKNSADIKIQQESKSNVLSKTVGDSTAILIEDSVKDSIVVSQAVGVLD